MLPPGVITTSETGFEQETEDHKEDEEHQRTSKNILQRNIFPLILKT